MKTILAAVALTALIPAAAAQAQETRVEERVVVMAGPGGPMDIGEDGLTREAFAARHAEIFDRLDADHDGVITRAEMAAMAEAHGGGHHAMRFHGADGEDIQLDGDGEWTSEDGTRRIVIVRRGPDGETVDVHEGAGVPGEGGERHVMVFRHDSEGGLDADGDGRWSFDEMTAPLREHFNQLDANHDGFVDEAERRH
jgi:hypothetical protein